MKLPISEFQDYLILADKGQGMKCYKTNLKGMQSLFIDGARIVEMGLIQTFEIYTKCPETGTTGWDIHYVEGVKEYIERYYPNFDCFLTQDNNGAAIKFHYLENPRNSCDNETL